ncbi:hypothetical protein ACFTRD_23705 [Paenibacillus sp. NPDC056933]|uniref:hypothetical protein n=1 Tax=Paenibacillus sp. NPDC056933 TaxID=3345968 RepID=UPI003625584E
MDIIDCYNDIEKLNVLRNEMVGLSSDEEIFSCINILVEFIIGSQKYLRYQEFEQLTESVTTFIEYCNGEYTREEMISLYNGVIFKCSEFYQVLKNQHRVNIYFLGQDDENIITQCFREEYTVFKGFFSDDKNLFPFLKGIVEKQEAEYHVLIQNVDDVSEELVGLLANFDEVISYKKLVQELISNFVNQKYYSNYDYYYLSKNMKKNTDSEILAAGSSYSMFGLNERSFDKSVLNLSLASQDLYYSHKIVKEALKYSRNIKYCIIGMSYYSFHFDLSRSKKEAEKRINKVYYPIFKDSHHFEVNDSVTSSDMNFDDNNLSFLYHIIFNKIKLDQTIVEAVIVHDSYFNNNVNRELFSLLGNVRLEDMDLSQKVAVGQQRAEQHNQLLVHNKTVEENTNIMRNLINYLNEKRITPIVVAFPATEYYQKFFDHEFKAVFYEVMNSLANTHTFKLVDLFNSDDFVESDFLDMDHLNEKGAVKVSNMLNMVLNSLQ